ncbi:MAG: hypothetical protein M1823_006577, partial [Watsoniomyces obsoletus]
MPTSANGGNPFGGPVGGNPAAGQVDESAFKNMWNFNLADAAFGYLVLEVEGGRIGTEMRAQGFNFAHRGVKPAVPQPIPQQSAALPAGPPAVSGVPTGPSQGRSQFTAPTNPFPQAGRQPQQQPPRPTGGPSQTAKTATPPTTTSPAPPITQGKPLTPQPSSTGVPTTSAMNVKQEPTANGTDRPSDSEAMDKTSTPPAFERKPSTALFVMYAETEAAVREYLTDADKEQIKSIQKMGKTQNSFKIQFETHEIAASALRSAQEQIQKVRKENGKPLKISYFQERDSPFHRDREQSHSQGTGFRGASQAGS